MNPASLEAERQMRIVLGDRLKIDEPLNAYTTFRIGGPADFLATVNSTDELITIVTIAREVGIPWRILGRGSNLLVADRGARGLVVRNAANRIQFPREPIESPCTVVVDAGVSCARLASQAARAGLGGVEFLVSIPGTIGGAIVQDAGAHGSEIVNVLQKAEYLDAEGKIQFARSADLAFGYRTSWFKQHLGVIAVLRGYLSLNRADPEMVNQRIDEHRKWRAASQPAEPSAGSIFANPPGDYAGRLIEAAGLKGLRVGNAQISTRHANFIVNLGNASAHDVMAIIQKAQFEVHEQFGVRLEPEIERFGDWT